MNGTWGRGENSEKNKGGGEGGPLKKHMPLREAASQVEKRN